MDDDTAPTKMGDLFQACADHFHGIKLADSDFGLSTNNNYIQLYVTQLRLLRWGRSAEIGSAGWDDILAEGHERAHFLKEALERIDQIFKRWKAKPPPTDPPPPLRNPERPDGRWKLTKDTKALEKLLASDIFAELYRYRPTPGLQRWTIHLSRDHSALLRELNNEIRTSLEVCHDRQKVLLDEYVDAELELIDRSAWRWPMLDAAKKIRDFRLRNKLVDILSNTY